MELLNHYVCPVRGAGVEIRQEFQNAGSHLRSYKTLYSAVSHGTERLVVKGDISNEYKDAAAVSEDQACAVKLGYQSVVFDPSDPSKLYFCFGPHQMWQLLSPDELIPIPSDVKPDDAVFLGNLETATNLTLDCRPLLGENIAIIGCGFLGLLLVHSLARFPLKQLEIFDKGRDRLRFLPEGIKSHFSTEIPMEQVNRFDCVVELSGSRDGFALAEKLVRKEGRIIVGSWYGDKVSNNAILGSAFHHKRIRIYSSQVSEIAPGIQARYDKARRFDLAFDLARTVQPSRFVTNRYDFFSAKSVYEDLCEASDSFRQYLFFYEEDWNA